MELPMDPKPRPNQKLYLEILRRMTPEQKLAKAFELTEFSRELFRTGLRQRHPDLNAEEFQKMYIQRITQFHNSDY